MRKHHQLTNNNASFLHYLIKGRVVNGSPFLNSSNRSYDNAGNWTSTTANGTTENRTHSVSDAINSIGDNASTNDLKGNLTAYEVNGKDHEVEYDLDNRIIKAEVDNDDVEKHRRLVGVLDRSVATCPDGGRVKAREASLNQCAEHKHQAGQIKLAPLTPSSQVASPPRLRYDSRQGRYGFVIQNDIMAHPSRLNSVIARAKDGSKFKLEWYHKNYLDHVYAVSDDSGDILEHYRYTTFGEVTIYDENGQLQNNTQIDNHILWNTRRRDEVTGYYMYKYRHYSAELGRWPSRDPIEENGGMNLYAFVGNDGINGWDYLGLQLPPMPSAPDEPLPSLPPTIGMGDDFGGWWDDDDLGPYDNPMKYYKFVVMVFRTDWYEVCCGRGDKVIKLTKYFRSEEAVLLEEHFLNENAKLWGVTEGGIQIAPNVRIGGISHFEPGRSYSDFQRSPELIKSYISYIQKVDKKLRNENEDKVLNFLRENNCYAKKHEHSLSKFVAMHSWKELNGKGHRKLSMHDTYDEIIY